MEVKWDEAKLLIDLGDISHNFGSPSFKTDTQIIKIEKKGDDDLDKRLAIEAINSRIYLFDSCLYSMSGDYCRFEHLPSILKYSYLEIITLKLWS